MPNASQSGLLPILLALTLLLASATLAAATEHEDPHLELDASQTEYAPNEAVALILTNNGTQPTHGTPTLTIHECNTLLEDQICRETVHTWTGDERTLEPDETLQIPWDKTNQDGEPANEAHHQATLEWDTPQGTQTVESDTFYLHDPITTPPDAPEITIHQPTQGALSTTTVPLHVTITARSPLEAVHILVDGETLETAHNLGTDTHETQRTLQQAPGAHTLTVQTRDADGRANETTLSYTVAPNQRTTSGPLGFDTLDEGEFEDVRIEGVPLFTKVETTTPGTLHARTATLGLAFWTHPGAHVTMTLAPGWTITPQGQGVMLEHDDIEHPVIATVGHGTGLSQSPDTLVANLASNDGVIVRPLTDAPGDELIGDAILDGRLGAEIEVTPEDVTVFPYGPVNVTVAPSTERVAMIMDASNDEALGFIMHLDAQAFPYATAYLDGDRLPEAQSAHDVLQEGESQAFIQEGEETTRVFASVESFSARELVIDAAQQAGAFVTAGTLVVAGSVVALAGWGLFRRP